MSAVGMVVELYHRDREAAGAVVGSAIAFRLFLFFAPLLLFFVGVAGFVSGFVTATDFNDDVGASGGLAAQVRHAFEQPGSSRWLATLLGLFGIVIAGRSLSRALSSASAVAWRLPVANRASVRITGSIVGLICGMGLIAAVVNRFRVDHGYAVASVSFVAALGSYFVAWLVVSLLLPRATTDPGALLPGTVVVSLTITVMHAVSELYLPDRLEHASQLYGAIGATLVTLGWFFILGRAIVLALMLNAVTYERYGSVSTFVFSLPVVRILPRRFPRMRRFFELDERP